MNAQLRNGSIHQQKRSQNHGDDAPGGQHAMGLELGLKSEQDKRCQQHHQRDVTEGKHLQRVEREQYRDEASDSGYDGPGMVELEVNAERAYGEQQEGNVGIQQD